MLFCFCWHFVFFSQGAVLLIHEIVGFMYELLSCVFAACFWKFFFPYNEGISPQSPKLTYSESVPSGRVSSCQCLNLCGAVDGSEIRRENHLTWCMKPWKYLKVKIDGWPIPKGRLVFRVLINQYVGTVPSAFQLL